MIRHFGCRSTNRHRIATHPHKPESHPIARDTACAERQGCFGAGANGNWENLRFWCAIGDAIIRDDGATRLQNGARVDFGAHARIGKANQRFDKAFGG